MSKLQETAAAATVASLYSLPEEMPDFIPPEVIETKRLVIRKIKSKTELSEVAKVGFFPQFCETRSPLNN